MEQTKELNLQALEQAAGGEAPGRRFAIMDFVYITSRNRKPGWIIDWGAEEETYLVAYGSRIDSGVEEGRSIFHVSELEERTEILR